MEATDEGLELRRVPIMEKNEKGTWKINDGLMFCRGLSNYQLAPEHTAWTEHPKA